MPHHVAVYAAGIPAANVYTELSAAQMNENQVQITNPGRIVLPQPMDLIAAFGIVIDADLDSARISTAGLRGVGKLQVTPTNRSAAVGALRVPSDPNIAKYQNVHIASREEITAEVISTAPSPVAAVLLFLQDEFRPVPDGPRYVLRFTAPAPTTFQGWTPLPLTFEDTLEAGWYSVYGMEVRSVGAGAARLTFDNQVWRPGCVAIDAAGDRTADMFYDASMGEWGRFASYSPPRFELGTTVTGNSVTGALHVVHLGVAGRGK